MSQRPVLKLSQEFQRSRINKRRISRSLLSGLLVLGLIAQSLSLFGLTLTTTVTAATLATASTPDAAGTQQPDFGRNSKQKRVSIQQEQPDAGPVAAAAPAKMRPDVLSPAVIFYAFKTTDDTGTAATASCASNSLSNGCSLRSALTLALNRNPSASSAVLVLLLPSASYGVTRALPVVPSYTILSSTADQSCPTTASFSTLQPAATLNGTKGLLLTGSNSVVNGLAVVNFPSNGIYINGPNNTVSCSLVSNNGNSGITVRGGKALGNVIKNNLIGVTADSSTAADNGNSSGDTGTVCNPGPDAGLSEDCNGIFLAGDINGAVQNTVVTGNTIAAYGPQSLAGAIFLDNANNNVLQGNFIGSNQNITAAFPTYIGIFLVSGSNNNSIGGDVTLGQGNLVANTISRGIAVYYLGFTGDVPTTGANNNKIQGNAIGVDFNGNSNPKLTPANGAAGQNFAIGILSNNAANSLSGTIIGYNQGTNQGNFANLIGNSADGIYIYGQGSVNTQINGNWIGVSKNGDPTSANNASGNLYGIHFDGGGSATTIQNNTIGAANLTSANPIGVYMSGFVQNCQILGNNIESNTQGIYLVGTSASPNQNLIKGNVIAHNNTGIQIGANSSDSNTQRNTISQNSIYANTTAGININYPSGNGVSGGADSGPNNQAQPPTIQSVTNNITNALTVSGQASPNSIVEIFQGDSAGGQIQGRIYLGSTTANAGGSFTLSGLAAATLSSNAVLVATSTLNDAAFPQRVGSTSAFSNPYSVDLSVSPDQLNFKILTSTVTASQTVALSTQLASANYTSNISYGIGATGWLAVTPNSGTLANNGSNTITATVTNNNLSVGVYNATVTFTDSATNVSVNLNVQLTVSPVGYYYYLPFLANNYTQSGTSGSFTTYLAFQNTTNSSANVSLQYYDENGNSLPNGAFSCASVTAQSECVVGIPPFASGSKGSGVLFSDQPLAVVVPEATPYGGSAYVINAGGAPSLVAPLAINGAFGGYFTQLTVFNGGATAANVTINFYNQDGSPAPSASNQIFTLSPHTSRTFAQNDPNSGLPGPSGSSSGFSGWAQISGSQGSQLTAQVLEQNLNAHFVAIANAQPVPFGQTRLYAPAVFNQAFGAFVTGVNVVNPTANATVVKITYYDNTGKTIGTPTSQVLAAHAVLSVFQPAAAYLSSGFYGSAEIDGNDLVMVVNENGGLTATGNAESGVYNAVSGGSNQVSLPVMSNGGYGYTTGTTILNAGSTAESVTITYFDTTGANKGQATYTIQPHASQPIFQGNASLPSDFYGTAQITTTDTAANLLATTNAISPSFFYTYTEPAS